MLSCILVHDAVLYAWEDVQTRDMTNKLNKWESDLKQLDPQMAWPIQGIMEANACNYSKWGTPTLRYSDVALI